MKPQAIAPHITIVTSCTDDWGGCEELWAKAIPVLQQAGCAITVCKDKINVTHPEFIKLASLGVPLTDLHLHATRMATRRSIRGIGNMLASIVTKGTCRLPYSTTAALQRFLEKQQPQLAVIAQAINFDGIRYAAVCMQLNIPYVLIAQKAVDFFWPSGNERLQMQQIYSAARHCYFVSQHNRRLTEEQCAAGLANAQVVFNPVKVARRVIPWPGEAAGYRLACIGRYFLLDKGQDLLLRILAKPQWQRRNITVSFIGSGPDRQALTELAAYLGITNVTFSGPEPDIEAFWQQHHALLLPSRSEGLPLVVQEAMAAGRPVIATDAGGTAELVADGISGFTGHATEAGFEDAMERAWARRGQWKAMGDAAATRINELIPERPEEVFANHLLELLHDDE